MKQDALRRNEVVVLLRINLLKKGDEFVGMYGNLVAVKKSSGEVELTEVILDENGCIRLEHKPKIIIGYGDNVIDFISEDNGVQITTF